MEQLCIDIMNSNHVDWQSAPRVRDMLEDETWMNDFLNRWKLEAAWPLPAHYLMQLKALRETMRGVITALGTGQAMPDEELTAVNQILEGATVTKRLIVGADGFRVEERSNAEGWRRVVWQVALSFAGLLATGEKGRIKICDNENCGWVFYDASKNRSRRWCDDAVCGNIMKARRYRARHRGENG